MALTYVAEIAGFGASAHLLLPQKRNQTATKES